MFLGSYAPGPGYSVFFGLTSYGKRGASFDGTIFFDLLLIFLIYNFGSYDPGPTWAPLEWVECVNRLVPTPKLGTACLEGLLNFLTSDISKYDPGPGVV